MRWKKDMEYLLPETIKVIIMSDDVLVNAFEEGNVSEARDSLFSRMKEKARDYRDGALDTVYGFAGKSRYRNFVMECDGKEMSGSFVGYSEEDSRAILAEFYEWIEPENDELEIVSLEPED